MLRRVALIGLLLLMSGVAAIFAAGHFGIPLPWDIAATTSEDAAPKTESAPPSAAPDTKDSAKDSKSASDDAQNTIQDTMAALNPPPAPQEPQPGGVEIDISRISPDGTSVFAGRAEPDTYVTVLEDGKPAGSVKADANGEWSLATEHKFASADPKLTFEASKTAPPTPEPPKPPERVAAAAQPAAPAEASASAVAGEVMRKFEKLVEDAREEAKKQREAAAPPEPETPKADPTPALPVTPDTDTGSGTDTATATPIAPDSRTAAAPPASEPTAPESSKAPEKAETPPSAAQPSTETAAAEPAPKADTGPSVIPVPIMFVYNEAKLTSEGKRAADLLLEYLTLKHLKAIELTGHADERGTHEYNMDLSRDRLETVSALLREGGYDGELKLTPKGKTEPYTGVDRSSYRGEALYQLDRRVELRVGQ